MAKRRLKTGVLVWVRRGRRQRRVGLTLTSKPFGPKGWILVRLFNALGAAWSLPQWVPAADLLGPVAPRDRRARAAMQAGGADLARRAK